MYMSYFLTFIRPLWKNPLFPLCIILPVLRTHRTTSCIVVPICADSFSTFFHLIQMGTRGQHGADPPVKIDLETLLEQSNAITVLPTAIISLHQRLVKWSEAELTVG